jgi:hypothetical protein
MNSILKNDSQYDITNRFKISKQIILDIIYYILKIQ